MIVNVKDDNHFRELKSAAAKDSQFLVIKMTATWCGPCHAIQPHFERLSNEYKNVVCCSVDVDKLTKVAQEYSVRAMPTFVVERNGRVLDRLQGANPASLKGLLAKHATEGGQTTFPGHGHTLASTSNPSSAAQPSNNSSYLLWIALLFAYGLYRYFVA